MLDSLYDHAFFASPSPNTAYNNTKNVKKGDSKTAQTKKNLTELELECEICSAKDCSFATCPYKVYLPSDYQPKESLVTSSISEKKVNGIQAIDKNMDMNTTTENQPKPGGDRVQDEETDKKATRNDDSLLLPEMIPIKGIKDFTDTNVNENSIGPNTNMIFSQKEKNHKDRFLSGQNANTGSPRSLLSQSQSSPRMSILSDDATIGDSSYYGEGILTPNSIDKEKDKDEEDEDEDEVEEEFESGSSKIKKPWLSKKDITFIEKTMEEVENERNVDSTKSSDNLARQNGRRKRMEDMKEGRKENKIGEKPHSNYMLLILIRYTVVQTWMLPRIRSGTTLILLALFVQCCFFLLMKNSIVGFVIPLLILNIPFVIFIILPYFEKLRRALRFQKEDRIMFFKFSPVLRMKVLLTITQTTPYLIDLVVNVYLFHYLFQAYEQMNFKVYYPNSYDNNDALNMGNFFLMTVSSCTAIFMIAMNIGLPQLDSTLKEGFCKYFLFIMLLLLSIIQILSVELDKKKFIVNEDQDHDEDHRSIAQILLMKILDLFEKFLPPLLLLGGELLYMSLTKSDFDTCIRRGLLLFLKDTLTRKTNPLVGDIDVLADIDNNNTSPQETRLSTMSNKEDNSNRSTDNDFDRIREIPAYRKRLLLLVLSRWIIEYWDTKTRITCNNLYPMLSTIAKILAKETQCESMQHDLAIILPSLFHKNLNKANAFSPLATSSLKSSIDSSYLSYRPPSPVTKQPNKFLFDESERNLNCGTKVDEPVEDQQIYGFQGCDLFGADEDEIVATGINALRIRRRVMVFVLLSQNSRYLLSLLILVTYHSHKSKDYYNVTNAIGMNPNANDIPTQINELNGNGLFFHTFLVIMLPFLLAEATKFFNLLFIFRSFLNWHDQDRKTKLEEYFSIFFQTSSIGHAVKNFVRASEIIQKGFVSNVPIDVEQYNQQVIYPILKLKDEFADHIHGATYSLLNLSSLGPLRNTLSRNQFTYVSISEDSNYTNGEMLGGAGLDFLGNLHHDEIHIAPRRFTNIHDRSKSVYTSDSSTNSSSVLSKKDRSRRNFGLSRSTSTFDASDKFRRHSWDDNKEMIPLSSMDSESSSKPYRSKSITNELSNRPQFIEEASSEDKGGHGKANLHKRFLLRRRGWDFHCGWARKEFDEIKESSFFGITNNATNPLLLYQSVIAHYGDSLLHLPAEIQASLHSYFFTDRNTDRDNAQ